MTLKEFILNDENHFVAMEYYKLILNRTFLILVTEDKLIGLLANGTISTEAGENILAKGRHDIITRQITRQLAVRGDLSNPYSYIKEKYIREIENDNIFSEKILLKNKANFVISRRDIKAVQYDPKKKFGMGNYPHDGKIVIETKDGKKREFIILGDQSGQTIADIIQNK